MNLREQTISGILWSVAAQGGQQALQFVLFLVLARLLTPADFGLIGMVAVFSAFAMLFTNLGLGAAVVQRSVLRPAHLDSAFWLNVGAGSVLALLFVALAPALAALYGEPRLVALVRVIALSFLLVPATVVQKALLQRAMNFRRLVLIGLVGQTVGGAAAIGLALGGAGVWSLVAHGLVTAAVTSASLWAMSDWRPSFCVERQALQELWTFGGHLTGFNILNYWVRNADDFLIGRYVGAEALGLYGRAYSVMMLPLTRVTGAVGEVMFPALTRMKGDRERSQATYLRAVSAIAFVTFPAMLGLLVVADEFVLGVLGRQWAGAIPILRVFCLVGTVQSVGSTVGWIFQAQGRTDWLFRWGLASSVLTVTAFLVGLPWGALGVAVAYASLNVLLAYPNFWIPGRLIGVRVRDVGKAVAAPILMSLAMAGAVWLLDLLLGRLGMGHLPALLIEAAAGAAIYVGIVLLLQPQAYRDIRSVLAGRRPLRQPSPGGI